MLAKAASVIVLLHVNSFKMCAKPYTPRLQFPAVQPFLNEAAASDHDSVQLLPKTGTSRCRAIATLLFGTSSADTADHDAEA